MIAPIARRGAVVSHDLCYCLPQLGKPHGLHQMPCKAGVEALADVAGLAIATEGYARDVDVLGAKLLYQLHAGAIGETEITEQEIKGMIGGEPYRAGQFTRALDPVAGGLEESAHDAGRVCVIFHEEDAQALGGRGSCDGVRL